MIHIAGMKVQIGSKGTVRMRQRCAWCGAVLADYDLSRVAVYVGDADPRDPVPPPAMWEEGALIEVEGTFPVMSRVVEHEDGAALPEGACALLDDEVTV